MSGALRAALIGATIAIVFPATLIALLGSHGAPAEESRKAAAYRHYARELLILRQSYSGLAFTEQDVERVAGDLKEKVEAAH